MPEFTFYNILVQYYYGHLLAGIQNCVKYISKKSNLWRVQNLEVLEENRAVSHYNQMFGICF